jgi:tRNA pseudouridine38-40 synthase
VRYFIEIAYYGASYCGWQRQPNALSVQQVLEEAMTIFLRTSITVVGAGRTDAGVHAKQLFAHFDFLGIQDISEAIYRINALLPEDISVTSIRSVVEDAHARFHASERAYAYHIVLSKNPFTIGLAHQIHKRPNIVLMNEAANLLLGHQDFQCFSRSNTDVKTYYCDVKIATWVLQGNSLFFTITADRFLRNMVRAVVGTLLDVGFEKKSLKDFKQILASKDRSNAGASAPAQGLYLTKVAYPEAIFIT